MKQALNVVVLMGGPSEEHAVSLKSGHGAAEALLRRGLAVEPMEIPRALTIDEARAWVTQALRRFSPDVVFLALHGAFGEDGTIQQLCEELGVAYTGSDASASRLGMDKIASRQRFSRAGLSVPRWRAVTAARLEPSALAGLRYPLVVKPFNQGSSVGVSLVACPSELSPALEGARRYSSTVLVEEFIQGRELTVGAVGDEVLPVVEIIPKHPFFDFAAKYTAGMTDYRVPAVLDAATTHAVQDAARRAHEAIGCRHFSRTDLILSDPSTRAPAMAGGLAPRPASHGSRGGQDVAPKGRAKGAPDLPGGLREQIPVVLEVNTIPGLTPTSLLPKAAACLGISYDDLCEQLVMMACPPTNCGSKRGKLQLVGGRALPTNCGSTARKITVGGGRD